MRVIGIDPGTARTGWGIIEFSNSALKAVTFGCIKTTTKQSGGERLKLIYDELLKLMAETKPDEMAIEKIFFNTNVKTALSVGQARGVCILAAATAGLPISEYNTTEVKNFMTGYGRATKSDVADRVKELFQLEVMPKPDDVTDALAIATTHITQKLKLDLDGLG